MNFKDNPDYRCCFTLKREGKEDVRFYEMAEKQEYHLSRFVTASAQNIYSSAGVTPDMLNHIMDRIIEMCNSKDIITTIKTDIAMLANQVKYRTKYPVDEHCAIRMGAIYTFMQGEDPNTVKDNWTQEKVKLAQDNPDLYSFFLHKGIAFTPAYRELLEVLNDSDYLKNRQQTIHSLNTKV